MNPIDDEFEYDKNDNNQDLSNSSFDTESDETTLEEFFDKVVVKENKNQKKVVIIKPENTSGTGDAAPSSISHKFNWGAFLFNWIWGIKYNKWVLLIILFLLFIPYGFIPALLMAIWAGINGNQWAWEEVQYKNEEDFNYAQRSWVKWWFIIFGTIAALCLVIWFSIPKKQQEAISEQGYSFFTSKELDIPQQVYDDTSLKDPYSDLLMSDKYIIYWLKPKTKFTESNRDFIEEQFEKEKDLLNEKFVIKYDLVELKDEEGNVIETDKINENTNDLDIEPSCIKKDALCIQAWLYKNCNNGYCIINAKAKKYYKVRGKENVVPRAIKLLKSWD